ncbi:prenyltransferase and squalene oxidase protein [Rutstroemia sp. NJR-2017a WRK4]|nr:prenyltransferase and squalene oxidase protein [Rutstroemia sp. NJR-2017a WRK4]
MAEPKLEIAKHIKYWHRCLNSLLPTAYTSTDSTRMTLGFFILSALDLLGEGPSTFPESRRKDIREWVLRCQHPLGGFCGSSNHRYPDIYYADVGHGRRDVDPANLAASFFAVLILGLVGGIERVRRRDCLSWLRRLQREDGSFGELVTEDGKVRGGRDMRYCYVATALRWMLTGDAHEEREEGTDINVESLVEHLRRGQTYDGGISESSEHEAHAGYAYCAIASLSLLDRLPKPTSGTETSEAEKTSAGLTNLPETLRWLVLRQSAYTDGDGEEEEEEQKDSEQSAPDHFFVPDTDPTFVGFNGRCNKRADTCYTFWVGASLNMLGHSDLINKDGARRFLLEKTQHMIGGFGKTPGNPPDIYHSYLGLAILAALKEPGLKELDSALCISVEAKKNLEELRRAALVPSKTYWKHGYSFLVREDSPEFGSKMAAGESPPKSLLDAFEGVKLEG